MKTKEDEWKRDVRANNTGFFWKLDDECTYTIIKNRANDVAGTECRSEGTQRTIWDDTGKISTIIFLQILLII